MYPGEPERKPYCLEETTSISRRSQKEPCPYRKITTKNGAFTILLWTIYSAPENCEDPEVSLCGRTESKTTRKESWKIEARQRPQLFVVSCCAAIHVLYDTSTSASTTHECRANFCCDVLGVTPANRPPSTTKRSVQGISPNKTANILQPRKSSTEPRSTTQSEVRRGRKRPAVSGAPPTARGGEGTRGGRVLRPVKGAAEKARASRRAQRVCVREGKLQYKAGDFNPALRLCSGGFSWLEIDLICVHVCI